MLNRDNGTVNARRGITGLETAIILIAFVVVASVFALTILTTAVVLVLTVANALAPYSASGGHRFRFFLGLGVMLVITGAMMAAIPPMADSIFSTITAPANN